MKELTHKQLNTFILEYNDTLKLKVDEMEGLCDANLVSFLSISLKPFQFILLTLTYRFLMRCTLHSCKTRLGN